MSSNKVTLQGQIDELERQITVVEQELANLNSESTLPNLSTSPDVEVDLTKLHQVLSTYFSQSELRNLCFKLGISYEEIDTGKGLTSMARELIAYCKRHGQLDDLIQMSRQLRPHAWA